MIDKNQPLIIEEDTDVPMAVQGAPIAVGIVESRPNANYPPQGNYNSMYGQPPNYIHQGQPQPVYPNYNYNQGQPQPAYYNPIPPPPPQYPHAIPTQIQNHPQIILIQQQMLQVCPACGFNGSLVRRQAGCVTFSWCVLLFCLTGIFCCWVPFCIDSCYDVQVVCGRCGIVKSEVQASCA